jgi:hypothetical protein
VSDLDGLVPWLRRVIGHDQAAARDLIESEAAAPVWYEMTSGVLVTGPPEHDDTWSGTFAIGDSRITRFIAEHDPRDTIARCESELSVLDEHQPLLAAAGAPPASRTMCFGCGCRYPCRTVRLLGRGYRFRPGYRESEWKP